MRRFVLAATTAALVLLSGTAFAEDPLTVARQMVEDSKQLIGGMPGGPVYTDRMLALWDAIPDDRRAEFLTESDLAEPNFMLRMTGNDTAEVDVALWRADEAPLNITLELQLVGDRWLVDEIRSPDSPMPMSEILQQVADSAAGN